LKVGKVWKALGLPYLACSQVRTRTNRSGGVQGGLSNGEDIVIRVAFKPTSTIGVQQKTVGASETTIIADEQRRTISKKHQLHS
jgi:chorismate synthase